jgi:hypothetical protein
MVSKLSINGIFEENGCKEQVLGKCCRNKKQKVIERRKVRRAVRELPLVAQEIKTKQKSHYDDDEEQGESDNVTDIHY